MFVNNEITEAADEVITEFLLELHKELERQDIPFMEAQVLMMRHLILNLVIVHDVSAMGILAIVDAAVRESGQVDEGDIVEHDLRPLH